MSTIYSVWLHQLNLAEYVKKQLLLMAGDCKAVFDASWSAYQEWGFSKQAADRIMAYKPQLESCEQIVGRCTQQQIEIIEFFDKDYPWLLREIPDPPIALYFKGDRSCLSAPMIAVVGARKCSEYGYQVSCSMARQLAEYGLCVVSGLAMGVDGAAHLGALQVGSTVGVLGTGVDICYPACNQSIYRKVSEQGALISEYPPDTPARPYHFPRRNRIISGMCYGTVVVEAAERSGSLITAQLAMDYFRDVFAVPGNVNCKLSQGTNALIRQGAKCVTCAEDVIVELPDGLCIKNEVIKKNKNKLNNELAEDERIVYANVSQEPILYGEILENTKLSCERINTSLLQLEMKGLIKRLHGERYERI